MITISFYTENYKKAFSHLKKNPVLLTPDIFFLIFTAITGYITLIITDILPFLKSLSAIKDSPENIIDLTTIFFQNNLPQLITAMTIFFFATFIVGAGTTALKFTMIREVLSKKKITLKKSFTKSRAYFWRIISVRILTFLLYTASLIIGMIIFALLFQINDSMATAVTAIFLLASVLLIFFSIYVRFPMMYKKKLPPTKAITLSYHFFRKNKSFVIKIAIIMYLTMILIKYLLSFLDKINTSITPIISIITLLILLITNVFITVFLFQAFEKHKTKN